MTTDGLYYAIGAIFTGGAVVSLLFTLYADRKERRTRERAGTLPSSAPHRARGKGG
ncbi:MAG: hypothetical protein Kow0092_30020 [Deferrisomatales bacterium]